MLINLIKKHVSNKPKNWHEILSQALWAYRNSPKDVTGLTLFKSLYGREPVSPVEVIYNLFDYKSKVSCRIMIIRI